MTQNDGGQGTSSEPVYRKIKLADVVKDHEFMVREHLNKDAVARYREMLASGKKPPAIKVQARTMRLVDGKHRVVAAEEEGVDELGAEILDVPDSELRTLGFRFNALHGVPITTKERDELIVNLRIKDGKTQKAIGEVVGLSHNRVCEILALSGTDNPNTLSKTDVQVGLVRLIIGGETQAALAKQFEVTQGRISQVVNEERERVRSLYVSPMMKYAVAEKTTYALSEVDWLLYPKSGEREPLNFTPQETTWWPSFGIDDRFGKRHPGNIPAGLVQNLLCRLTDPGDLILDPFAGGGVVIDVCADMVGRSCEAFDLTPVRDDVKSWDILKGAPPTSRAPTLIFLDPPYGPQKSGEYSPQDTDLANLPVEKFVEDMGKILGYWKKGWIVCLMTVFTRDGLGHYVHLPADVHRLMEDSGWKFYDRLVNQIGRAEGHTGVWVDRMRKANEGRGWFRRDDLEILIAHKG